MSERGYGDFAEVYDALTLNVPYDEIAEYYAKAVARITDGKRLLDMGCGTGNLTVRLKKAGFDAVGLDGSSEMLSMAAAKDPEKLRSIVSAVAAERLRGVRDGRGVPLLYAGRYPYEV